VDIELANRALEQHPAYVRIAPPRDMLELIGQYEYGLRYRLYEIVNHLVENNRLTTSRPAYVHDVRSVRTLPAIMYPSKVLNAAVNFYSHVNESGTPEEQAAARRQRREQRGVPYLFFKPGRGAVIGNGEPIVIPWGRDRIDWEIELGIVIGRTAKYVDANNAQDVVFGYAVHIKRLGSRRAASWRLQFGVGLVRRQGARHVRAAGPVDRAEGVLRQPDGEAAPDAARGRRAAAGGWPASGRRVARGRGCRR
jgi:2-keto-4-pentenoate hydratase/2-oxohepta-3-ene-1,7-dioic acid hydratase in catechol pathway